MTTQEAYEAIRMYFSQPGAKLAKNSSFNGTYSQCFYRMPILANGREEVGMLKCAVGCLIPDELYEPDMENIPACEVTIWNRDMKEVFEGVDIDFLAAAQSAHDIATTQDTVTFIKQLDTLAEVYDLTPVKS
jgi:hypothetical protein